MGSERLIVATASICAMLSLGATGAVQALELRTQPAAGGGVIVVAHGSIVTGDASRLTRFVARTPKVDEIWFHSPGGDPEEGVKIARYIRSKGFATRIPSGSSCASACNFAFVGGLLREVEPGGSFGVHMFTVSHNSQLVAEVTAKIRRYGAEAAGAVIRAVEENSAQVAARQSKFLLDMGVKPHLLFPTYNMPSDGIYWLTPEEQRYYLVDNVVE